MDVLVVLFLLLCSIDDFEVVYFLSSYFLH